MAQKVVEFNVDVSERCCLVLYRTTTPPGHYCGRVSLTDGPACSRMWAPRIGHYSRQRASKKGPPTLPKILVCEESAIIQSQFCRHERQLRLKNFPAGAKLLSDALCTSVQNQFATFWVIYSRLEFQKVRIFGKQTNNF